MASLYVLIKRSSKKINLMCTFQLFSMFYNNWQGLEHLVHIKGTIKQFPLSFVKCFLFFKHVQLSRQLCSSWNETKRYLFLFDGMTSHTDNNTAKKCCISQSKSVSIYMSCYLMFSSTLHCTKFAKVFKVSWKFVNHANLTIKDVL